MGCERFFVFIFFLLRFSLFCVCGTPDGQLQDRLYIFNCATRWTTY